MSEVLLNFVAAGDRLQPAEEGLDRLKQKTTDIGAAWEKTTAKMATDAQDPVTSTNKLALSIDNLAKAAKSADKAVIGGAYREYLKQIQAQLGLTSKELIQYVQNARAAAQADIFAGGKTDKELEELTLSISAMNEELQRLGVTEEAVGGKTKSFKAELAAAKLAFKEMLDAGKQGTPEFVALEDHISELTNRNKHLQESFNRIGSVTKTLDGLVNLAGGVAGGFAAAQGAMALFGTQDEEVQKALLKVNAAMSILQGLTAIQTVLQKESSASLLIQSLLQRKKAAAVVETTVAEEANVAVTEAQTVATEGQTVATEGAVVAQEELNVAMAANPVGLIILGIVALVAALTLFNGTNKAGEKIQRENNDALRDATQLLEDDIAIHERQTAVLVAQAKLQGKTIDDITRLEGNAGLAKLKLIRDQSNALAKKYNEEAEQIENSGRNGLKVDKDLLESHAKLLDRKHELDKLYAEEENALRVKALEFEKKLNDDKIKSFIAFQDAKVAATIAGSDAEKTAQIEAIRATQADRLKQAKEGGATPGELAKIEAEDERNIRGLQLQNYQHYLKGRIAANDSYIADAKIRLQKTEADTVESINRITDLEIAAARKRQKETLSDPTLNAGERRKIVEETNLQILQLEKQKQTEILTVQKAGLNAQLIIAKKGSQEEYDLKVKLIDNQQEVELSAAQLTAEQRLEIERKFQKQRADAFRALNEGRLQDEISVLNAQLDQFALTESEKLRLTLERIEKQRLLEISAAEGNGAKILEIEAKIEKERLDARKAAIIAIRDEQLKYFDALNAQNLAAQNKVLSSDKSTLAQKKQASKEIYDAEITRIDLEDKALKKQLADHLISQEQYNVEFQDLQNKAAAAQIANEERITAATLKEIERRTQLIKNVISTFSTGLSLTLDTSTFSVALNEINNFGAQVQDVMAKVQAGVMTSEEAFKALAAGAVGALQNIINQSFADQSAARQQFLAEQLADLEQQKETELGVKNLTEQQKRDIEEKYKRKEREEKIKAFEADKQAKKSQAIINGFLAISLAFATTPFPASLITAAVVAAETLAAVSHISNEKTPRFKDGKINIQGPGTTTSDSIPARISVGESVINAKATAKHKEALTAINEGRYDRYMTDQLKNFVYPDVPDYVTTSTAAAPAIDYGKLAEAMASKLKDVIPPALHFENNIDEEGIHQYLTTKNSRTEYKNRRYIMD